MAVWIGVIIFDDSIVRKLHERHNVTEVEVLDAVSLGQAESAVWHDHEVHGRRLLARGFPHGSDKRLMVVLIPADNDEGESGTWICKTAVWEK